MGHQETTLESNHYSGASYSLIHLIFKIFEFSFFLAQHSSLFFVRFFWWLLRQITQAENVHLVSLFG